MVLSLPAQVRVFLARGPTDMRKAFDGLCAIVRHQFHCDPFNGDVFAFFNRDHNRVKLLGKLLASRLIDPMVSTKRATASLTESALRQPSFAQISYQCSARQTFAVRPSSFRRYLQTSASK